MLLTATSPNISSASLAHSPHCTGDHVMEERKNGHTAERSKTSVRQKI